MFNDREFSNIYWFVPISSQLKKYKLQYEKSINKYKKCDNINFGYVLGNKTTFLPQNLFSVTDNYVNNVYVDSNTLSSIAISSGLLVELCEKARKKIRYNEKGKQFGLSNAIEIYQKLISEDSDRDRVKVLVGSVN